MSRKSMIVIPDAHACPGYDNDRFEALGKYIARMKPDALVSVGDFADMPSLSQYDRKTLKSEGRRYALDVEVTLDAQERLRKHIPAKLWDKMTKVITLGNHEDRINIAANQDPHLFGTIRTSDLGFEANGWTVIPYKDIANLYGYNISHTFSSGNNGLPIGGVNAARTTLLKFHDSCISGHSHLLSTAEETTAQGRRIVAFVPGNFGHLGYGAKEGWCRNTYKNWWNGVLYIDGIESGDYTHYEHRKQEAL